ncbi:hypothetical protein EW145_g1758 [Phellinidium pouzarii]|uniref:Cytochrome b5 heme-binding domain-containing protein n=1 Tax=Phellinidium pouzarii TaxID=167371 RepID=A0A4S4LD94_9AGAM|nr:hypothetical protein EW145_g1758 [Phellinidium pouzarii]
MRPDIRPSRDLSRPFLSLKLPFLPLSSSSSSSSSIPSPSYKLILFLICNIMAQVIVVGGGLAGLSAAHTLLERGANVLLLDKQPFMGGNSTKATSGINGSGTAPQQDAGIQDSSKLFFEDTKKSAKDLARDDLIRVLTGRSGSAVDWLQDKFALDLSKVARLGGHSQPRTHRGGAQFPGMVITYAQMERLEDLSQSIPDRVQIKKKACVTQLLKDSERVIGVEYELDGKLEKVYGPVILATGGYAADFTTSSLLKKYRPELWDLPTTNGEHCTGDGQKLAMAIGANGIDLEKVQVHPTGLVDPNEPDAKVKFLAAEALRGVGGLLLDNTGKRFVDELQTRDYVTAKMWENGKYPIRLVLNGSASKEIEWHYYTASSKAQKDPFGKRFFQNSDFHMNDVFHVAIMTPVLHYTMGGLEIDAESRVLGGAGAPIAGLFAAGEVAGGVHGANRLGGSSLLGCVVFGRVAGDSAAAYLLQNSSDASDKAKGRLGAVAGHLGAPMSTTIMISPEQGKIDLSFSWAGQSSSSTPVPVASSTSAPASVSGSTPATTQQKKEEKVEEKKAAGGEYTAEEVAKHKTKDDIWVIVNGEVLDVTKFLPDHPGGEKAILLYAGRDATEEFNMLHDPKVIPRYAADAVIGKVKQ